MSSVKEIPITKDMVHIIMTGYMPQYLYDVSLSAYYSNAPREVIDLFVRKIILLCAIYNNVNILDFMIKRCGGDPEAPLSAISQRGDNRTALNIAREKGSTDVVEYLLTKPAQQLDRQKYLRDLELPINLRNVKLLPGRRADDPEFLSEEFMAEKNKGQHEFYNGLGGKRRRSRRRSSRRKSTRRRSGRR